MNLLYMIGSFASGANAFLVAINGTKEIILSTVDEYFFVSILTTKKALAPLANDPILLGRFMWLFRHLQNKIHLLFLILLAEL